MPAVPPITLEPTYADTLESREERIAIMMYDAGMTEDEAMREIRRNSTRAFMGRLTDN